ncbi:hypothetical protein CO038_03095 [Candidatus Pacearchaeota archaeon CG_4_9_14_0_2_um_filter_39_13]|nr:hypothetical protein [Candidatus Pacearchaeota archaeon]OIO42144.1 MAG: hypothetical protein AUJ64_04210 [Candidatus Pacearchaeota archaeon CG1_02_39_14]PJC44553.1 MAG: hypothetical protein CO038_03095 [Candidatus Pacearchaeota archaeon CG_4_9_14_0_2_um_filter_39_13]
MNKRGVEQSFLTIIAAIVVIGIVVFVALYFFTDTFSNIERARDVISPEALTLRVEACRIVAGQQNINELCYVFKEVEDDVWVSCFDGRITDILSNESVNYAATTTCDSSRRIQEMRDICSDVRSSDKGKTTVDGKTCELFEKDNPTTP